MLLPTAFRLILVAWLAYVAVYDWRTWTVPWWTTWPVIAAACLGQAAAGAGAPLALFALCFLWDTTASDLKRLVGQPSRDPERDERRWLIPAGVAYGLTIALLAVARGQGEAAFCFTTGFALVHLLWRLGRLPGGDAALLSALLALFPSPRFLILASLVVAAVVLPRLAWRDRHDLAAAVRSSFVVGPWAAFSIFKETARAKSQPEPVAYLFSLAGIAAVVWL
jgi:Flp pilus assembly protein protease CpaA